MRVLVLCVVALAVFAQTSEWVEIYSGFTAQKFSDLDGWVIQNAFQDNTFSTCGNVNLVGGYKAFGKRATALKQIKVPPHYKLKVNIQLWKIDSWDNEYMQIYLDGYQWQAKWHHAEGSNLCGSTNNQWNEAFYNIEFVVPHNALNTNLILTSTLDEEADNESWAFRDVHVYYLPCAGDCGVCHNPDVSTCFFWAQAASSWFRKDVAIEDWTLQGGNPKQSNCAGINIFGGQGNLGAGATLQRVFDNLPPHYQILVKFQFWKIDSWDNEQFRVAVDGVIKFSQNFQWNEGVQLCGTDTGGNQGNNWAEKIVNVDFQVFHQTPSVKLTLTSTLDEKADNESWGIRDFFLFVGQCHRSCTTCSGPTKNDCTSCDSTTSLVNGVCKDQGKWYVISRDFDAEEKFGGANDWVFDQVLGSNAQPFSKCGDVNLVGGYGKFGKGASATKKFSVTGQVQLRLQVQLWKIDSWDGEELFILANDQKIFSIKLGFNDPQQANLCGASNSDWKERILDIDTTFKVDSPTVTIKISSTLDQDANDESWGFRNFALLYLPKIDCVVFYSECQYKGTSFELCKDEANLPKAGVTWWPKSIKIPGGYSIDAYTGENFVGEPISYNTDQECIADPTEKTSFFQLRSEPQWLQIDALANNNLRRKNQY